MIGNFRMTHDRGHHPEIAELLRLDGNAAFADADIYAGGILLFLVELIAQDHGNDGERADDEVESVAIHRPGVLTSCLALDARLLRREQIYHRTRSAPDL